MELELWQFDSAKGGAGGGGAVVSLPLTEMVGGGPLKNESTKVPAPIWTQVRAPDRARQAAP